MNLKKPVLAVLAPLLVAINGFESTAMAAEALSENFPKPPQALSPPPSPDLGLPPTVSVHAAEKVLSKELAAGVRELASQLRTIGYKMVDDGDVSFLSVENISYQFVPLTTVTENVSSPLATLSGVPGRFNTLTFLGAIPSEMDNVSKKWSRVSRYFSLAGGATLVLSEIDYVAARVSTGFPEELVNQNIGGFPGMLVPIKTSGGNVFTRLTWGSNKKLYQIYLTGHARGVGATNELVELANKIQEQE